MGRARGGAGRYVQPPGVDGSNGVEVVEQVFGRRLLHPLSYGG
ncbi:hypothetical protein [Streptomyces sulfonofaciens]|nr:hypothetical protein [Streptomyces sulfonofaciens]